MIKSIFPCLFDSVNFYIGIEFASIIISVKIKDIIDYLESKTEFFSIFFGKIAKNIISTSSITTHEHCGFYECAGFKFVYQQKSFSVNFFFGSFSRLPRSVGRVLLKS